MSVRMNPNQITQFFALLMQEIHICMKVKFVLPTVVCCVICGLKYKPHASDVAHDGYRCGSGLLLLPVKCNMNDGCRQRHDATRKQPDMLGRLFLPTVVP